MPNFTIGKKNIMQLCIVNLPDHFLAETSHFLDSPLVRFLNEFNEQDTTHSFLRCLFENG